MKRPEYIPYQPKPHEAEDEYKEGQQEELQDLTEGDHQERQQEKLEYLLYTLKDSIDNPEKLPKEFIADISTNIQEPEIVSCLRELVMRKIFFKSMADTGHQQFLDIIDSWKKIGIDLNSIVKSTELRERLEDHALHVLEYGSPENFTEYVDMWKEYFDDLGKVINTEKGKRILESGRRLSADFMWHNEKKLPWEQVKTGVIWDEVKKRFNDGVIPQENNETPKYIKLLRDIFVAFNGNSPVPPSIIGITLAEQILWANYEFGPKELDEVVNIFCESGKDPESLRSDIIEGIKYKAQDLLKKEEKNKYGYELKNIERINNIIDSLKIKK